VLQFIKRAISLTAQSESFEKFVTLLEHVEGHPAGLLRILTYHRVDEPEARPWLDPGLISATPEAFREQMGYLATHYQPVTIKDVITAIETRNSKDLPSRAVLITFDDGYCDFKEHAWPILKHYGFPVTLFVPTAYPDQPERTFWWDDLYQAIQTTSRKDSLNTPIGFLPLSSRSQTYKLLKNYLKTLKHAEALARVKQLCKDLGVQPATNSILDWDSLQKLANEGVTLGAHTRTHPLMNRITLEEAREEAVGSLQDLKHKIGSILPIFAYPSGEFNDEAVAMLEAEGFRLAFTTKRGINNLSRTHPLRMRRINVGGRTTLSLLRAQLLPWTVHLNKLQTLIHSY
jgi:peptidoglycan/xylan/chitin deacetylase (PgdA/CDA1 family)